MDELEALVILASTPRLGSIKIRLLLKRFGSASKALEAPLIELQEIPGFNQVVPYWERWLKDDEWRKNMDLASRYGVEIIPFTSENYPKRLLEIPDFPILLYVKGDVTTLHRQGLAVVGTRQASLYGNAMAERFGTELAAAGYVVTSGLARGIDTSAHKGALQSGKTMAVIGSGLADIYPTENRALAEEIAAQGALVSEFAMSTPPDRQNFPQRNRIVSGMTMGTILIEAPVKSGAMITVERAISQGKKVFALPGRADQENFQGNHALIKNGQAFLVENAQDVIKKFEMLFDTQIIKAYNKVEVMPGLEPEEAILLRKLPSEELSIDELQFITSYPISKLNVLLMSLVLKKVVKESPGKMFQKCYSGS